MAKESKSEFTANGMMALAPTANRTFDALQQNGWKVGAQFCRPVKPSVKKIVKNKSFLSRFL